MHRIPIRDIMQRVLVTIRPDQLVADAAQMMEEFNIRRLPVVDDTGYLVGIVTDADVHEADTANRVLNDYEPGAEEEWLTVGDVMTREVVTIPIEASVGQLAATLMEHKIGGLPVIECDPAEPKRVRMVGIVTETDIFQLIVNEWQGEGQG
ncbi:MAG: CBS domain-containing protein [Chloroflexi bacterium]|nr:CBS domain-containing protein [Chloroflexota bacterium]